MPDQTPLEERAARTNGPIHGYFGLTYANYLVLQRSLLQSMPVEWQERFTACLNEIDTAISNVGLETPASYDIRILKDLPEFITEYPKCGECDDGVLDGDDCPTCEGHGQLVGKNNAEHRYQTAEEVGFTKDPIPHYDRGRTFVELGL